MLQYYQNLSQSGTPLLVKFAKPEKTNTNINEVQIIYDEYNQIIPSYELMPGTKSLKYTKKHIKGVYATDTKANTKDD